MRAALSWINASPLNAALVAGVLGVMPLLQIASGGVIAMTGLRLGMAGALTVTGGALLPVALAGWLGGAGPAAAVLQIMGLWLPVLLLTALLRRSGSLPLTLQAATLLGLLGTAGFMLSVPDPAAVWRAFMEAQFGEVFAQLRAQGRGALAEQYLGMARLMTGMTAAMTVLITAAGLMLGRWAQSVLDRPGAFGREFRAWCNGRAATVIASAFFLATLFSDAPLAQNLALVLLPLLLFQGLGVAHYAVHALRLHVGWLVGLYALFLPLSLYWVSLLAVIGFADEFFDFRAQLARLKQDR